jgi:hypothetical protein
MQRELRARKKKWVRHDLSLRHYMPELRDAKGRDHAKGRLPVLL